MLCDHNWKNFRPGLLPPTYLFVLQFLSMTRRLLGRCMFCDRGLNLPHSSCDQGFNDPLRLLNLCDNFLVSTKPINSKLKSVLTNFFLLAITLVMFLISFYHHDQTRRVSLEFILTILKFKSSLIQCTCILITTCCGHVVDMWGCGLWYWPVQLTHVPAHERTWSTCWSPCPPPQTHSVCADIYCSRGPALHTQQPTAHHSH